MNSRLAAIPMSVIREIHNKKRPTSIDLGLGEPTLKPEMGPLRVALADVEANGSPYSPNPGLTELRAQVATYHGYPGMTDAAQVGITVGSQEALAVAIAALGEPGQDEALIVEPAYPLYAKLCDMFGLRVRSVALDAADGFTPRASTVLSAIGPTTRILILASPMNPTGRIWTEAELKQLAEGLAARGGPPVYVISDEVYRELYFDDRPPASPASFWPHTVAVGSISKSCALTGLRVGWFIAPKDVAPALHKAHQFLVSSTTTFGQRAVIEIFKQPSLMRAHRPIYLERRDALLTALRSAGLEHVVPDGAFYAVVKLRGPLASDSMRFCLSLLEQKDVVAIPGIAFGIEGWARVSFVGEPATIREGVNRIAAFCD